MMVAAGLVNATVDDLVWAQCRSFDVGAEGEPVPQQEGSGTSLNLAAWARDPPLSSGRLRRGSERHAWSTSADPVRCRSEVQSGANQPAGRWSYAPLSLGPFSAIRI